LRERTLAHDSPQDRQRKLRRHLLAGCARAVALYYVGNFVGDDACQLGFVVRRLDRPQIYENWSARKSKSVDFLLIHHMKAVWPLLARSVSRQLTSQPLHV